MTGMWALGATHAMPQTEDEVRLTAEPVRTDPQNAEDDSPPDWNEIDSDESGELAGLSPRVEGSYTIDSEQYVREDLSLATQNHNEIIDNQVASSGTAAAREAAGEWGHGTAQYAIGIDPLNPAEHFGNKRFLSSPLVANEGSGDYMTPVGDDNWSKAVAQAASEKNSRDAYMATQYKNFFASQGD